MKDTTMVGTAQPVARFGQISPHGSSGETRTVSPRDRLGVVTVSLLVSVLASWAHAQEWTRFRGPNGTGVSSCTTVPVTWTEGDCAWKVTLPGTGHSSPVVWGEKLFLTCTDRRTAQRTVLCLRTDKGALLWRRDYASHFHRQHRDNSFAASTPAVDAEGVYIAWTTPGEVTVLALDHRGQQRWRRNLGPFESKYGGCMSPVVVEDLVVLANDQRGASFLIALDRGTGETRWKVKRRGGPTAYATPCLSTPRAGAAELIFVNTTHGVTGVDPRTGAVRWELSGLARKPENERPVSSPVIAAESVIVTYGMFGKGSQAFAVLPGSAGVKPAIVHRFEGRTPYVPTPIVVGDRLILWHDTGLVSCYRTGTFDLLWRGRAPGSFYGSPVCVGGRLYCTSKRGEVIVLGCGDSFELLGRTPLGERSYATPAISGGRMYLRTVSSLISVGGEQ